MRFSLEVTPGDPRARAIVADALAAEGVEVTFEPVEERRGAGQAFEVARGAFELAGDYMLAKALVEKATEKWPAIKARIVEFGPHGGRHR